MASPDQIHDGDLFARATPGTAPPHPFKYDAYIAYSRLDRQFAQNLQQNLEWGFRRIAPQFRGNRKELRICRDETDFTASEDLPAGIRQKLSEAANLIVICSPNARNKSHWVAREIEDFRKLQTKSERRIIAVVLDGDDPLVETAFPVGLIQAGSQPLAVDFRRLQLPAEIPYDEYVKGDGTVRVLAPLLSVEYPTLKDRQAAYERAQNRRRLIWAGAITLVFALLALYAFRERNAAVDGLAANYWSQGLASQVASDRLKAAQMYALAGDTTREEGMREDARFAVSRLTHGLHLACRARHGGAVRGLVELSSQDEFLTWSDDGTAILWNAKDCSPIFAPLVHGAPIAGAAINTNESLILTYSLDGTVRLWQRSSGTRKGDALVHGAALSAAEFSPNGKWIVSWGKNKIVKLWNVENLNGPPTELHHDADVRGILFSPDGATIASWTQAESLQMWSVEMGTLVGGPWKDAGVVLGAVFNPDSTRLLSWNLFGAADLWNVANHTHIPIDAAGHKSGELGAFSPDGRKLLTWDHEGGLVVRDGSSGRLLCGPIEHAPPGRVDATFDANGTHFVSWGISRTARVWNSNDCKPTSPVLDAGEPINGALFLDALHSVLTWDWGDSMRVWDIETGTEPTRSMLHRFNLRTVVQDPRSGWLLSRALSSAQVWDPSSGMAIGPPMFEGDEMLGARLSTKGAAVWTWGRDGFASRWDFDKHPLPYRRLSHEDAIVGTKRLGKSDRLLTWTVSGTLRVWDTLRGELAFPPMFHGSGLQEVNVNADESDVVTIGADGRIRVWDLNHGILIHDLTMSNSGTILGSILSPDGKRIALWSEDARLEVITLDGSPTWKSEAIGLVRFVEFSDDGSLLAVCNNTESCQLLRTKDFSIVGRAIRTSGRVARSSLIRPVQLRLLAQPPPTGPREVYFMAGHQRLITLDADGTLQGWDTKTAVRAWGGLRVKTFVADPSGQFLVAWSDSGDLYFGGSLAGEPSPTPIKQGIIKTAIWAGKSGALLTISEANAVRIWDGRTGKPLTVWLQHDSEVAGAAFTAHERSVITWCVDGTVRLWNISTGVQVGATMRHTLVVSQAEATSNGRVVLAAAGNAVSLWFASDGSPASPGLLHPEPVQEFYLFSNPSRVVTSVHGKDLWLWDLSGDLHERNVADYLRRVAGTAIDSKGALAEIKP